MTSKQPAILICSEAPSWKQVLQMPKIWTKVSQLEEIAKPLLRNKNRIFKFEEWFTELVKNPFQRIRKVFLFFAKYACYIPSCTTTKQPFFKEKTVMVHPPTQSTFSRTQKREKADYSAGFKPPTSWWKGLRSTPVL